MPEKSSALKYTRAISAPAAQAYFAFTRAAGLRAWLSDKAEADLASRQFSLWWKSGFAVAGAYTAHEEDSKISFRWHGFDEPAPSEVQVELQEKEGQTQLSVTHRALGSGAQWQASRERINKIWEEGLENLQHALETGYDLRHYRRPMVGIGIGELVDAKMAKGLSLPVDYGVRLSGVLPGMGAESAGVRGGDIVVQLGAHKITDYPSIETALSGRTAGDVIEVGLYRGAEKLFLPVALSARPRTQVPPSALGLSEAMAGIYADVNGKLMESFDGVSEDQAEFRPAPGEWSSKEVLAHLTATERDMYGFLALEAQGMSGMNYTSHFPTQLKAILKVSPRVADLLDGLKRSQDEGVAFLSELPADFVGRKMSYVRAAAELLEYTPYHYKEHLEQIENNLVAARGDKPTRRGGA